MRAVDVFDDGAQDSFYTRDQLLVAFSNHFALGAEIDLTVAIQNSPGKALRSLALGPAATFSPLETQKSAWNSQHDFVAGRLTATYLW